MTLAQRYSKGFSMAVVDMCFLVEGTPRNYNEAVEGPEASKWTKAIDEELAALNDYGTWEETDVVPKCALDTTWVFKIKTDKDGNVARRKARLVIRGYMQIPGVDFGDTYAPVTRVNSMRCVLAIAASRDYEIKQFDVDTAFLNPAIDYEIYIKRPQGSKATTRYLKLLKSLYGLRQSPRCWNKLLDKTLKTFGYVAAPSDPCLYIYNSGDAYLVVYVDDLVLCARDMGIVCKFEDFIETKFAIKKLGDLNFFLGVTVSRDCEKKEIYLSQMTFIDQLVARFDVQAHGLLIPMKERPAVNVNDVVDTKLPFRELVGALLYLQQWTRPDISFAVSVLSRHLATPTAKIYGAGIDVIRYLKKTRDLKLCLGGKLPLTLAGYCDADLGSAADRKSQTGYIFLLGDNPVSWRSVKQTLVAASTVEAEYIALNSAVSEALYLQQLLHQLKVPTKLVTLFEDNMGVIHLAKNPVHHDGTKHFDIRLHRVRDYIEKKNVQVCYVRTTEQLADGLTKPLTGAKFNEFKQFQLEGKC
ncbi:hypothetical protein LEN26_018851 [Aphanomyces euteiches]|nr:hypothetical protein LEN26_018851 [Aphanomyces euteiches]